MSNLGQSNDTRSCVKVTHPFLLCASPHTANTGGEMLVNVGGEQKHVLCSVH